MIFPLKIAEADEKILRFTAQKGLHLLKNENTHFPCLTVTQFFHKIRQSLQKIINVDISPSCVYFLGNRRIGFTFCQFRWSFSSVLDKCPEPSVTQKIRGKTDCFNVDLFSCPPSFFPFEPFLHFSPRRLCFRFSFIFLHIEWP